ncbi:haloacid dehalogenase [Egicoccus sp. AB-alg6-2]|uniref:haloacid dehalogenase n=1 Tax=Egicoccus sp. AB-alg6-2 TaxID=3242692 RepID=UPI00359D232A
MSPAEGALLGLTEPVRGRLVARHEAREVGLAAGREAIRAAANAIRATHRDEIDRADALIDEAREALQAAYRACGSFPDVLHAGFVQDAAKEVAEAVLTRAAVAGEPLPGPDEVGVDDVSWLHGLAETIGELRRASLDHVRGGRVDEAEAALALMQEILAALMTIDVPDGLSRGLRRATDAGRAITERTRGDLTTAAGQRELRRALDAHREALERVLDQPS